ncbi:2-polyprenyl-6-methoxyphenol hydroxylase [Modicisalibacter muralis]|uniref:2-polyprenyl-6-methoxyphenol hydroxylase n=1 Tax=Modicisalibacter muralis TaxID=119000 RepID=A0A1G9I0T4_9GAMM|nr:NAD(P)/FAD-dependent oxidoreductase [Halomonas muralis]SDL18692.1 2-polyprenyl-6-methoxyphenol hydroxylase [Halomonas muralis]
MRVLIVGGGIAGLTLAALLERQGKSPVVVDRRAGAADPGYGLALWPHGSRVFHALGIHDAFVAKSEPMVRYTARDDRGRLITSSEIPSAISRFGHLGIIPRADLIELLDQALGDTEVRHGLSIDTLSQADDHVEVRLSDGTQETFDLVIGADGIHSRIRQLLFGRLPENDTGWGCFVWWGDSRLVASGETTEHWGAASFLGIYPCREQVCIIVGAPIERLRPDEPDGRADRLATLLTPFGVAVDDYLAGLPADTEPLFLWRMTDVRAPAWVDRRVALVGDAAAAFLPTAGIGASMALESAAVLADELSRTNSTYLTNALDLYVKRRRGRVEAAQDQSRRLARLMFIKSRVLAHGRDRLLRFFSMEQMLAPLIKDLKKPL